jgi:hypothetical protein
MERELDIPEIVSELDNIMFTRKRDWYFVGGLLRISGIITPRTQDLWSLKDPYDFEKLNNFVESTRKKIDYYKPLLFSEHKFTGAICCPEMRITKGKSLLEFTVVPSCNIASGIEKETDIRTCNNPLSIKDVKKYELDNKFLGNLRYNLSQAFSPV